MTTALLMGHHLVHMQPPLKSVPLLSLPPSKFVARFRTKISKTIVLISLSGGNSDKPSSSKSKMSYDIVTQTLNPNDCSPSAVARQVSDAVGFEVVFLDSKCFPLLDTSTTSNATF